MRRSKFRGSILEHLLANYGYLAVLIGTFFEGEAILVLGGYLAHMGYMDLSLVMLCAFGGTYAGDQACYYLGKYKGLSWLARRPQWQRRSERLFALMHKYRVLLILGFRYLYGLRSLAPFVFALCGVKPLQFLLLNGIGALIWAVSVGALGYLLGNAIDPLFKLFDNLAVGVLAGAAALLATVLYLAYRRKTP